MDRQVNYEVHTPAGRVPVDREVAQWYSERGSTVTAKVTGVTENGC